MHKILNKAESQGRILLCCCNGCRLYRNPGNKRKLPVERGNLSIIL